MPQRDALNPLLRALIVEALEARIRKNGRLQRKILRMEDRMNEEKRVIENVQNILYDLDIETAHAV